MKIIHRKSKKPVLSRPILTICLQVFLALPFLFAQSGSHFLPGEIYMLGRRGIYQITGDINSSLEMNRFIKLNTEHRGSFTHDAYRNKLIVAEGRTVKGIAKDSTIQNIAIFPIYEKPILLSADDRGNIFVWTESTGANYIDQCGRINAIDDQLFLSQFETPTITVLFYHQETHSLFLGLTETGAKSTVFKLPLDSNNQLIQSEIRRLDINVSGSNAEVPTALSYGPLICQSNEQADCEPANLSRKLMLFVDTNSTDREPRILTFDPFNFDGLSPYFAFDGAGSGVVGGGVFPLQDKCSHNALCGCINTGKAIVISWLPTEPINDPGNPNPKRYYVQGYPSFSTTGGNCNQPGQGRNSNHDYPPYWLPFDPLNQNVSSPMLEIIHPPNTNQDLDCDGVEDTVVDNCPNYPNGLQLDQDGDGIGDTCDRCPCLAGENCNDANEETNTGLYFDSNDLVNIPDDNSLDLMEKLTIEAWINIAGPTENNQNLIRKNDNYILGYIPASYKTFEVLIHPANSPPGSWKCLAAQLPPGSLQGKWVHFCMTYESGDFRLYVNGHLDNQRTDVNGPLNVTDFPLHFGSVSFADREYFKGQLDEVRIWDRVRTAEEIATYKDVHLSGHEEGLKGYWQMEEGTGNLVKDLSPFMNHGQFANAPSQPTWRSTEHLTTRDSDRDGISDLCEAITTIDEPTLAPKHKNQLLIFPNPASHVLNILQKQEQPLRGRFLLKNTLGQILQVVGTLGKEAPFALSLDVSPYPRGLYFLIYEADGSQEVISFVISK